MSLKLCIHALMPIAQKVRNSQSSSSYENFISINIRIIIVKSVKIDAYNISINVIPPKAERWIASKFQNDLLIQSHRNELT